MRKPEGVSRQCRFQVRDTAIFQGQFGCKRRTTVPLRRMHCAPTGGCRQLPRRKFLNLAAGAAAVSAVSSRTWAQTYPSHSVRLIVPFPPGGPNDVFARLIGQWLYERLGQPFIIDNRPGAGGNIGTEVVVKAAPDGYTLLLINSNHTVNATLYDKLNYNFIRDIAPVAAIIRLPLVLVLNPLRSSEDPSGIHCPCEGQSWQTQLRVGRQWQHTSRGRRTVQDDDRHRHGSRSLSRRGASPYRSHRVDRCKAMFIVPGVVTEHIKAGKLRAVAVTAATRSDVLPDLPTVNSIVTGYDATDVVWCWRTEEHALRDRR